MLDAVKKIATVTNGLIVAGVLGAVAVVVYVLMRLRTQAADPQEVDPVCEVFFFYTQWCPYCKKARAEWDKFKTPLNKTSRDGYTLMFTEVDCDSDEALANKFKIEGYPTIKCVKDGKVFDYDARPSVMTLNLFLDSCF